MHPKHHVLKKKDIFSSFLLGCLFEAKRGLFLQLSTVWFNLNRPGITRSTEEAIFVSLRKNLELEELNGGKNTYVVLVCGNVSQYLNIKYI